jgi:hypothetical protein
MAGSRTRNREWVHCAGRKAHGTAVMEERVMELIVLSLVGAAAVLLIHLAVVVGSVFRAK